MVGQDTRTEEEKRKGRRQRYVHAGFYRYQSGMNPVPADFRKKEPRSKVKGGRWGVRKIAVWRGDGKYWHAYNRGTLKGMSARFYTQEEAMSHAVSMSNLAKVLAY